MTTSFFHKQLSGPFTIPSGIVATTIPIIAKIIRDIPEIGVITTKSVGLEPRAGNREPILNEYATGCMINAVGLTNPGAEQFAAQLAELEVPDDRFMLTSIFGKDADELTAVARILAPHSDGLELNLSCPHASGYGMDIGQDADLVREIVAAVKSAVDIPVIAKLTPNVTNIGAIARAAADGGADGICAINTVGPGYYTVDGHPVLTNERGGISGTGILPIGLKCVYEIAEAVSLPIVGCGGIASADDVRAYRDAGATIFGVGSTLIGLSTPDMTAYFRELARDVSSQKRTADTRLKLNVDMRFKPYTLVENRRLADDLAILVFDRKLNVQAGELIFVWLPGIGEKPFSVLADDPFTLVVVTQGCFTEMLIALTPGDTAYVRGPHGIPVAPTPGRQIVAVSGGTGLAALYQIARDYGNAEMFLGANTASRLYFVDECEECATVHIATDDGSRGYHGYVTGLLDEKLAAMSTDEIANIDFYNCGPDVMIEAATEIQLKYTTSNRIFNAVDYVTKCGVGICGICCAPDGRRLCVDGPFLCQG